MKSGRIKYLTMCLVLLVLWGCEQQPMQVVSTQQSSGTSALLQAISIIDEENIWVSGHQGTYLTSRDGGTTWRVRVMPEADTLQFRDVHAFSPTEALLMSAGQGKLSQIRKTSDGGQSWKVVFQMQDTAGFLNTIQFWDNGKGLAFGDAIAGELYILKTENKGENWQRIDPSILPGALGNEGGFAASGTCIATTAGGKAWIATGAGERPRVIYTADYGESWRQAATPISSGEAAGITTIIFSDSKKGFIAGGDLTIADAYVPNTAFTVNGGETWSLAEHPIFKGAIYGSALTTFRDQEVIFVCGPNGIDYSADTGTTWNSLDTANYWSTAFSESGTGWAVGKGGRILKINLK